MPKVKHRGASLGKTDSFQARRLRKPMKSRHRPPMKLPS
jgi:hypothetical protein